MAGSTSRAVNGIPAVDDSVAGAPGSADMSRVPGDFEDHGVQFDYDGMEPVSTSPPCLGLGPGDLEDFVPQVLRQPHGDLRGQ